MVDERWNPAELPWSPLVDCGLYIKDSLASKSEAVLHADRSGSPRNVWSEGCFITMGACLHSHCQESRFIPEVSSRCATLHEVPFPSPYGGQLSNSIKADPPRPPHVGSSRAILVSVGPANGD